ncbi:MAG: outer membrane beta-barrel protein [Bacteroidota bacterium]
MKKVILLMAALVATSTFVLAQTAKGTIMAGGSASASFQTLESEVGGNTLSESDNNSIGFNPMVGYFFIDQFVAGLNIGFDRTKIEDGSFESTSTAFSIGPFARYYLNNGVFFLANIGFGSSNTESDSFDTDSGFRTWNAGVGYAIFLNEWIAIEPTITYGSSTNTDDDQDPEAKFIQRGLQLNVGFNIFLH